MSEKGKWVLLAYRLPREPSTPRIALWRKLRRLGAVQILDGLVALPLDSRNREQMEWLAQDVTEAGGETSVWIAEPASSAQGRQLARLMSEGIAEEYRAIAREAAELALAGEGSSRTMARLRRELRRVRARDYFPASARGEAEAALARLAEALRIKS